MVTRILGNEDLGSNLERRLDRLVITSSIIPSARDWRFEELFSRVKTSVTIYTFILSYLLNYPHPALAAQTHTTQPNITFQVESPDQRLFL